MQFSQQIPGDLVCEETSVATGWPSHESCNAGRYFRAEGDEFPTVLPNEGVEEILRFDVRSAAISRRPEAMKISRRARSEDRSNMGPLFQLTGQFLPIFGERAGRRAETSDSFAEPLRHGEDIRDRHDPRQFMAADGSHTR